MSNDPFHFRDILELVEGIMGSMGDAVLAAHVDSQITETLRDHSDFKIPLIKRAQSMVNLTRLAHSPPNHYDLGDFKKAVYILAKHKACLSYARNLIDTVDLATYESQLVQFRERLRLSGLQDWARLTSLILNRINEINLNVNKSGYVHFQVDEEPDGKLTQEEIQRVIEEKLAKTQLLQSSSTHQLEQAILQLQPTKSKWNQVLLVILLNVLIIFLGNRLEDVYQPFTHSNQAKIVQEIKRHVQLLPLNTQFYNHYRFVTVDCLNVRARNTIKSRIIGKLYFGNIVEIVWKKKNWTLIRYVSEDGEIKIQGWVFTRYIRRFD